MFMLVKLSIPGEITSYAKISEHDTMYQMGIGGKHFLYF